MALPAKIFLAVSGDIHLGCSGIGGLFPVAFAAEFALARNGCLVHSRLDFVFGRHVVAGGALQKCMRRQGFRSGDLRVAALAFLRGGGRLGIMRIVAGDAWLHRIVRHRIDLRESCRPGEIESMAVGAELPFTRCHGLHLGGICDMGFGRAMAGFTGERLVITGLLDLVLLVTFGAWSRT